MAERKEVCGLAQERTARERGERPCPTQPHVGLPVTPPCDVPRRRKDSEDLAVRATFLRGERRCLGGGQVAVDRRNFAEGGGRGFIL